MLMILMLYDHAIILCAGNFAIEPHEGKARKSNPPKGGKGWLINLANYNWIIYNHYNKLLKHCTRCISPKLSLFLKMSKFGYTFYLIIF